MHRIRSSPAAVLLIGALLPAPTMAQTGVTLRVTRIAVIVETPRSDGVIVGTVDEGVVLVVLDQQGYWYLVSAPPAKPGLPSRRGWIHASSVELVQPSEEAATRTRSGGILIRGFGHAGGTLFTARDSFEMILGDTFGTVYGAGGQIVFSNGVFAQVSVDRFRETGSRALVSGSQVLRLEIPDVVTVTPIQLTGGYRDPRSRAVVPYLGAGVGWHLLSEESPTLADAERVDDGHIGYHILGGAEFRTWSWLWMAGEVQWAAVPKALGDTGISAVFDEDDLGGVTFRFKVIFGFVP